MMIGGGAWPRAPLDPRLNGKKTKQGEIRKGRNTPSINSYLRTWVWVAKMSCLHCAELGGIYLDPDVLVLRSFLPLRLMPLTLARESTQPIDIISNGIIICRPGVIFMRLWLEAYRTYDPDVWAYHSTVIPARYRPNLLLCNTIKV